MKHDEQQADEVQQEDTPMSGPAHELLVAAFALAHCADQQEEVHDEPGDEDAAQLAKDEGNIAPPLQPPVGGHPGAMPAGMELPVTGPLVHRTLLIAFPTA